jgi:hypothetical protein
MRDNYGEYGVEEVTNIYLFVHADPTNLSTQYYKRVGSTYRNPHYPGIRQCIFAWLHKWVQIDTIHSNTPAEGLTVAVSSHRWWSNESSEITSQGANDVLLFDMACGVFDQPLSSPPLLLLVYSDGIVTDTPRRQV